MYRILNFWFWLAALSLSAGCSSCTKEDGGAPGAEPSEGVHRRQEPVTLASLLDEMTSAEEAAYWPVPGYRCLQQSSYDRRSVGPGLPGWFANNDNSGFVRYDTLNGRVERVLFEHEGPGAVTRIWMTGIVRDAKLRFYFDGADTPSFTVSSYDMNRVPFSVPEPFLLKHNYYDERGGTTFFLPLPYASGCRITVEPANIGYAVAVNYRAYDAGTSVRTFSPQQASSLSSRLASAAEALLRPRPYEGGRTVAKNAAVPAGGTVYLDLPQGTNAVRELTVTLRNTGGTGLDEIMRGLFLNMDFDGRRTVSAPLGEFAGAGVGAPELRSRYSSSDGRGSVTCRRVMPYRESARVELHNLSAQPVEASVALKVSDWKWYDNTLYFHAAWRQEKSLVLGTDYDSPSNGHYNMMRLAGRGVYCGDVLSVYNRSGAWWGEGDEKIYLDGESFPSHFGTGTEDYYNGSFAPVKIFHTPFGGAPRADNVSSSGWNTFLRTRCLDAVPFGSSLSFDFELLGWEPGTADYASTVFWYGDASSAAANASPAQEAAGPLP